MIGILTWPAYGTWFARRGRGWIDQHEPVPRPGLPEPRRHGSRLRWPAARLDAALRRALIADLHRIAELREFRLLMVVAAEDHVHLLLACERDRDIPRLVQLIKGAASRALTKAIGADGPQTASGKPLPHQKWWSRQYAFRPIRGRDDLERTVADLEAHSPRRTTRFKTGAPISFAGDNTVREPS
ncbi:MAG: transposase [Planctomycetota bacterium]|jgi:REP element-mobilizing transposase RayT